MNQVREVPIGRYCHIGLVSVHAGLGMCLQLNLFLVGTNIYYPKNTLAGNLLKESTWWEQKHPYSCWLLTLFSAQRYCLLLCIRSVNFMGFPDGRVVKNLPSMQEMEETWVLSLGGEDPFEEEMAKPLQYTCLRNPTDRGAWWATVHGVAISQKWLNKHMLTW